MPESNKQRSASGEGTGQCGCGRGLLVASFREWADAKLSLTNGLLAKERRAAAAAPEAETPERRAIRGAAELLASGYVGKVIEVHYLNMTGKPKIARETLQSVDGSRSFNLETGSHQHMVDWDHFDISLKARSAVKRIRDAEGKLLFENPDIPFDDAAATKA